MSARLRLGLTPEQRAQRKIGGSAAGTIMGGDPMALLALWQELTGRREPDDLSNVLPVAMGSWTEELNRYWFEKQTGRLVVREGESLAHAAHPFMTCTLDGVTASAGGALAVFEAKHVGGFEPIETVVQRYQPQVHHAMAVAGLEHAVLSIFVGTRAWEMFEIARDEWYLAQLIDRERAFWACVESDTPPGAMAPIQAPTPAPKLRTVSMVGRNEWASCAADWVQHRSAAKAFAGAEKAIKAMVEADVGRAHGHGIECKRNKAGSLSIRETGDAAQ